MALSEGLRKRAIIATKVGLEWQDGKVWRNSSPARIRKEVEDIAASAHRLHRPLPGAVARSLVPSRDRQSLARYLKEGRSARSGINYSPAQMDGSEGRAHAFGAAPYNLFEREAEKRGPAVRGRHDITVLCYGAVSQTPHGDDHARPPVQGDDLRP